MNYIIYNIYAYIYINSKKQKIYASNYLYTNMKILVLLFGKLKKQ